MRTAARVAGVALMVATGCGPTTQTLEDTDSDATADGGSTTGWDEASSSSASSDSDSASGEMTCPCAFAEPAWVWCGDESPTAAVDVLATVTEVSELPAGNTRSFALFGGSIYMTLHEGNGLSHAKLHRWTPGDDAFEVVDPLGTDHVVLGMTAEAAGLLIVHDEGDREILSRWTPDAGLEPIADFDPEASFRPVEGSLRVEGGRAFVPAKPRSWTMDWPEAATAYFDVNLATGDIATLDEPLSGLVPHPEGWWARRPNLETFQYCLDYSCFRPLVPVSWQLVTLGGTATSAGTSCVEDQFGLDVSDAWVVDSSYVFATRASVRRIDLDGVEQTLWRGGGVVDTLVDGNALWVSASQDVEEGPPGARMNVLVRVALDDGTAERWLNDPTEDGRLSLRLVGSIEDQLYVMRPRADGTPALVTVSRP